MSLRWMLVSALAASAAACSTPTEIVVVVDAEPGLELNDLRIATAGGTPSSVEVDYARIERPWTLALRPTASGERADVTVTATIGEQTSEQHARMDFVDGERLLLYFYLSQRCADVECDGSCERGECVELDRDPCPFREPLPSGPGGVCPTDVDAGGLDGGGVDAGPSDAGPDAGPRDAGPDAGPPVLEACDPSRGVCDVDVGEQHACAISTNGDVYCWGSNFYGEIGQRPPHPVSTPTLVSGISDGVDVALGFYFSCVLSTDANVRCFGENDLMQLGVSGGGESHQPVLVPFPAGVRPAQIVAGNHFACALTTESEVFCWGANGRGQLGGAPESPPSSAVPLEVSIPGGSFTAVGLAAGAAHACAVSAEGDAYCWGQGDGGRLQVGDFTDVKGVAAGDTHTCVLDANEDVRCVGGSAQFMQAPEGIVTSAASSITAGSNATCALSAGMRTCWGANPGGHLGVVVGSSGSAGGITPSAGDDRHPLRTVAMGGELSCGITTVGALLCWGYDLSGGVGQGAALEVEAMEVTLDEGGDPQSFEELAAGDAFTCGRSADEVFCWGSGALGQHGDGHREIANAGPTVEAVGTVNTDGLPATAIVAGARHACAYSPVHGHLACWGDNSDRTLIDANVGVVPQPAPPPRVVTSPAGAGANTLCWHSNRARCVGRTDRGQGGASTTNPGTDREIGGLMSVSELAVGRDHACAVGTSSQLGVHCWGDNSSLQLGQSDPDAWSEDALFVAGTAGLSVLSAGAGFTCGIDNAQGVTCWGDNRLGQLGRTGIGAGVTSSPTAEQISFGSSTSDTLTHVVAGGGSACAFNERELFCWGDNRFGQLGRGGAAGDSIEPAEMPLPAAMGPATIQSVALGARHRCVSYRQTAPTALDRTFCWGSDEHGRSGSGRAMVLPPSEVRLP